MLDMKTESIYLYVGYRTELHVYDILSREVIKKLEITKLSQFYLQPQIDSLAIQSKREV